ncbi:hypothetical protein NWF34_21420 [Gordonia sp. GONU]|uniref:Uncharacterized protein n=1 Tax=Gordonia amicalis TaxID=89053 RepID=A0AAE4R6B3_9ACTN|nr:MULTISPECIES: hypothetical protein [Gordonia]MCR8899501.1 hypothetical protein [Gordonia sp. GONU]MCZ4652212.1 hypothetical protein [Gordonia amicalis]MDV6308411.1 hypothetical protein [Gordonia amicalis]MDV6314285.1 hypothetical protein [Gordonia amicalis]
MTLVRNWACEAQDVSTKLFDRFPYRPSSTRDTATLGAERASAPEGRERRW